MTLYSLFVTVIIANVTPVEPAREPLMTGIRLEVCRALATTMKEQARAESINIIAKCKPEVPVYRGPWRPS